MMSDTTTIMSGYLYKRGAIRKNIKKRWFILDVDSLKYCKRPQVPVLFADENEQPADTFIDQIDLRKVQKAEISSSVLNIDGTEHYEFCVNTKGRTYHLYVATKQEREKWVHGINKAIKF